MRHRIVHTALAITSSLLLLGCDTVPSSEQNTSGSASVTVTLPFYESAWTPHVPALQKRSFWCWAACIEMVFKSKGFNPPQEYFVKHQFQAELDLPLSTPQVVALLNASLSEQNRKGVFTCNFINRPLSPLEIRSQIGDGFNGNPFLAQIATDPWNNHLVFVYGYTQIGNNMVLLVVDPQSGFRTIEYNNTHNWIGTFLTRAVVYSF